jgi:hypothetical protein
MASSMRTTDADTRGCRRRCAGRRPGALDWWAAPSTRRSPLPWWAGPSTRRPRVVGGVFDAAPSRGGERRSSSAGRPRYGWGGVGRREDCHGGGGPLLLELGGALACAPFGGAGRRPLLLGGEPSCWAPASVRRSWAAPPASGRRDGVVGSPPASGRRDGVGGDGVDNIPCGGGDGLACGSVRRRWPWAACLVGRRRPR